ncbi:MAG TPA: hypothetical protein VGQ83_09345 [Polyangia bacterium]
MLFLAMVVGASGATTSVTRRPRGRNSAVARRDRDTRVAIGGAAAGRCSAPGRDTPAERRQFFIRDPWYVRCIE